MPGKVISFPGAVRTVSREVPTMARHHVVIAVGQRWYDVDVMGFVTPLAPATGEDGRRRFIVTGSGVEREPAVVVQVLEWSQSPEQGWRAVLKLEGSKEHWEAYWRELGLAGCWPGAMAEKRAKIALALWPRPSDKSSCATSAQKEEVHMTNAQNRDTAPREGAPAAKAATKPVGAAGKATAAKAAASRKRPPSRGGAAGRSAARKTSVKSAQTGATAVAKKPRPESKGARILELIGRAQGATLTEIMQATKWQAHSVRGFLSTAAKKQQVKITSLRSAGQRVYKLER